MEKKNKSLGKRFIAVVTGNPIVFLLIIAAIVVGCLEG